MLTLYGHKRPITKIKFSPCDDYLYTCSKDSTLQVWNSKGKYLSTYTKHDGAIWDFIYTENKIVAASSDGNVHLFDKEYNFEDPIRGLIEINKINEDQYSSEVVLQRFFNHSS